MKLNSTVQQLIVQLNESTRAEVEDALVMLTAMAEDFTLSATTRETAKELIPFFRGQVRLF